MGALAGATSQIVLAGVLSLGRGHRFGIGLFRRSQDLPVIVVTTVICRNCSDYCRR